MAFTAYTSRGGKFMFRYISDPIFSFHDTVDNFQQLVSEAGDRFLRRPDGCGRFGIFAINEKSLRNGRLQGLSAPAKEPDSI